MKTVGRSRSGRYPSPFKRAMVWLLLMPMLYAVTIGSVHADTAFSSGSSFSQTAQPSGATIQSLGRPITHHLHDPGCLLCALGQQLFSTTLATAVFVAAPPRSAKVHTSQPVLNDAAVPCSRTVELSFGRAELGSMFLAVLIGAIVSGDGRANWYKGVQLIIVYTIMAFLFYFMPEVMPG